MPAPSIRRHRCPTRPAQRVARARRGASATVAAVSAVAVVAAAGVATAGVARQAPPRAARPAPAAAPAPLASDQSLSGEPSRIWQTNDTVRALAVSGGVVYAGGDFTAVRPPDSPPGADEVARTRLAAFDAATGALVRSFDATLNGRVFDLSISPDGRRLYAVGSFTTVNGVPRNRIAAFHLPGGGLVTGWAPDASATVTAVHAGRDAIYVGGDFNTVNGARKRRLAALSPATGALLTRFTAYADKRSATIELAPDGSRLLIGGSFTTVNGVDQNAIASLDPVTGALRPWAATGIVPNRTDCLAHVTDIAIVRDTAYVAAEDEQWGCYDGTYAARVSDGAVRWNSYCYGAAQAVEVVAGWLYKASHQRDCGYDPGGFVGPENQRQFVYHRLVAQSLADGRQGHWSPNTNATTSNLPVGPRVLATDGTQLFVGGDFTTVNNRPQQGITRFQPGNGSAPQRPAAPQVTPTAAGTLSVSFPAVVDRDNGTLTYSVYRDGDATPIATRTAESWPWTRPTLRVDDTGLTPGSRHTYTVVASDGAHRSPRSPVSVVATAPGGGPASYQQTVRDSAPQTYWRLNDGGATAADGSGQGRPGAYVGGATRGGPGATGDDRGITVDGASGYVTSAEPARAPAKFSQSVWFRTTTLTGGTLLGFSDARTGRGTVNDRVVWMDNNGQLAFGLSRSATGGRFTYVRGPYAYNDGAWHHVVATYDGRTMTLYVDGVRVASASAFHRGPGSGHLRAGYVDLTRFDTVYGPNQTTRTAPNSFHFAGGIDEVALWSRPLTATEVRAQWVAGVAGTVAR